MKSVASTTVASGQQESGQRGGEGEAPSASPLATSHKPLPTDHKPPGPAIGARVKALRTQRGWRCGDLARLAGLDEENLRKLERGQRRRPQLTTLVRLAVALECTLQDLCGKGVGEERVGSRE